MTTGTSIEMVDPKSLLVSANVRKDVVLLPAFLESIKEHGVLVPIVVDRTAAGLEVVDGQRRTLAAVEVDLADVPVWVTAPLENDQERIIEQLVVNMHREDVSEKDTRDAIADLALFDMKVPAIAKKLGIDSEFVQQSVVVSKSAAAKELLASETVRFDMALVVAEFEDEPEQQKSLLELIANGRQWDVRARAQEFHDAAEATPLVTALEENGVTVIQEPDYNQSDPQSVSRLYTDEKLTKQVSDLLHEEIVTLAGDGLCAFVSFTWEGHQNRVPKIGYAIKGWEALGLFSRYSGGVSKATTPAEVEAEKVARRLARETTKSWVAASALRIEFLQDLVKRKALPKGWEPFVIARLLDSNVSGSGPWRMTLAILGLKEPADSYSQRSTVEKHLQKAPTRALHIGLAAYLGNVEGGYEFDRKGWDQAATKPYLLQLEKWGYVLSDVERTSAGYTIETVEGAA
ncbi:MAG: ParB/RepB/Spo0J family partition protein [Rhodoglobus sp.]